MANPIQMLRDWSAVKTTKLEILDALKKTRPGGGITIKDLKNPIIARSIIEILKENPTKIESMDHGHCITLFRKVDMHESLSHDTYAHLRGNHSILTAESVSVFGLDNESQLPERKWRDGVPDDVNGTVSPNAAAEEMLDREEQERKAWAEFQQTNKGA